MHYLSNLQRITCLLCCFFSVYTQAYNDDNSIAINTFTAIYEGQYDLFIPEHQEGEKLPVYIVLPGRVGKRNYGHFRNSLLFPALSKRKGIIFSPRISWIRPDIEDLHNIITDFISVARNTYAIDQQQITLIGYSMGADQATLLAQDKGFLFSSVILMATNLNITQKITPPLYIIHSPLDRYFPIKKVHKNITHAEALGCSITFIRAEGKHDHPPTEYISELREAAQLIKK